MINRYMVKEKGKGKKLKVAILIGIVLLLIFIMLFFTKFGENIIGNVISNLGLADPAVIIE
jgi:amino acid permease